MPYHWTENPPDAGAVLTLWPYRSLPHKGFAVVILVTFVVITIPLYPLLGTALVWGMLPFMLAGVAGLWWGLRRSYRDGTTLEELTRAGDILTLIHTPARGAPQSWECNIYWAKAELHDNGGPVPFYITLSGNGRTVEIGRFLSEDERKALFAELSDYLRKG
ncbi:Uncharacterized membrane protein [Salinihabitans flavidus]|uniref:Uncharacterized membrane protein n=1 Tax=Salinihabitans flavidus TaxID=569882 RepID=A0A1H8W5X8_9RHOB|nr:DUF2244 domain-containing protein [Salinihabitans flavidus]SEP23052.1 Uncharacterized membrane protein [Salinihabitans flavidus]